MGFLTATGGKKKKRSKSSSGTTYRELLFCEDGQNYAIVTSLLGHKRCMVTLFDEETKNEKIGIIRGNMKKSTQFVSKNCIVLVSLRDFQDGKCDIIHVYNNNEVKQLIQYEEITNKFVTQNDLFEKVDTNLDEIVFEEI